MVMILPIRTISLVRDCWCPGSDFTIRSMMKTSQNWLLIVIGLLLVVFVAMGQIGWWCELAKWLYDVSDLPARCLDSVVQ